MLAPIQQTAGLGISPDSFYSYEIKSMNRLIKHKVSYKASEWPGFCKLAKELIAEQESEIEKTVVNVGKYMFCREFKHVEISISHWS